MYRSILLPVDLNDEGSWAVALPRAVALCQAFGAQLHVATVVPDLGMPIVAQYFPANYEETVREAVAERLDEFVTTHLAADLKVTAVVGEGSIYQTIIDLAEDLEADLIVMAAHKPALKDYLLGPNAARVVRHSSCSVLVVRE